MREDDKRNVHGKHVLAVLLAGAALAPGNVARAGDRPATAAHTASANIALPHEAISFPALVKQMESKYPKAQLLITHIDPEVEGRSPDDIYRQALQAYKAALSPDALKSFKPPLAVLFQSDNEKVSDARLQADFRAKGVVSVSYDIFNTDRNYTRTRQTLASELRKVLAVQHPIAGLHANRTRQEDPERGFR